MILEYFQQEKKLQEWEKLAFSAFFLKKNSRIKRNKHDLKIFIVSHGPGNNNIELLIRQ